MKRDPRVLVTAFLPAMMLTFGTLNAQETRGTHGVVKEDSGAMPEAIREAYDDFRNYRFGEAEQRLQKFLKSAAGKEETARGMAEELLDKTARCRQALGHVQRIEVVDSLEVDRDGFFRQYRLPLSAGRILSRDEFPEEDWKEDAEMAYSNESGNLIILQRSDSNGNAVLTENERLVGGEWMEPRTLPESLYGGGNADFPFLSSDGTMLYYSCDGEESIGGYDILIAGRDIDGEYLEPTNPGMPINSPANEYLMAIDEENGVGWWATDRNSGPDGDTLTIYIYKLTDVRENIDEEDENLLALASLSDYRLTRPENADYSRLLATLRAIDPEAGVREDFRLPVAGGKYITRFADLPNESARQAMRVYIESEAQQESDLAELDGLRREYHDTRDTSLIQRIRTLENKTIKQAIKLRKERSAIYRAMRR